MLNSLNKRLDALRENRGKHSGFTLIELLIVIVILGILAAVVVFSVSGIQDKGQDAACKSDLATFTTAVEAYYANTQGNATYPATADVAAKLVPKYIHSLPPDTEFKYASTGGQTYTITGQGNCSAFSA